MLAIKHLTVNGGVAMRRFLVGCTVILVLIWVDPLAAQNEIPSPEKQIVAAVSPAPAEMKNGATVLGYDQNGDLVTLREGTNELICIADDPNVDRFHVACYFKEMEPFMERGRELRAEGLSREEVMAIRKQEIESGELSWPDKPMALYSLSGSDSGYDYSRDQLNSASPLYVVYVPYATEENTGIATKPASEGAPWLMNPGEPWAHIMISTGRTLGEESSDE
ncbi:MAG: hypothetical protein RI573_15265 [Balneolaceae bacterium]|nr:hypothetical protein [Balneolaceae bacterium]